MNPIVINGRFLSQTSTGVQRYATEMVRAIDRHLANADLRRRYGFRLLIPRNANSALLPSEHIPTVTVGRLSGQAWEQLELPLHARGALVLNLCNTAPLAARSLVVIHDASVFAMPGAYSPAFRYWYRVLIPQLGRRAVRIITVSEFSRSELAEHADIPAEKIDVIHPGSEHILSQPADQRIFARLPVEPGGYLLTVGSRSTHKNLEAVVSAVCSLNGHRPPLVTAGAVNPRVFTGSAAASAGQVHSAGYVTDATLRALYENAICLVYPSLYEGFGLPPLEAMTCGCPVIVARSAALPEVCGDAALYCDPRSADDIARNIRVVLHSNQRDDLRRRGRQRAGRFTWDRSAASLLNLIDRVAA